jgi:FOG: TPR repeat
MRTINKIILALTFLFSFSVANAQEDEKLIREGNKDYRNGNYSEAEVKYKKALDAKPSNADAQFNLGDALFAQNEYDEAFKTFQKVLDLPSDNKLKSSAVFNMGNCLLALDKYYDAFNVFKTAIKLNPDNEDALYNLEYCRAKLIKSKIMVYPDIPHGTVKTNLKEAFQGQNIKLTSSTEENFALSSYVVVKADNPEVKVDVKGNSFVMPTFDVVVSAEFKQAHKISVDKNIKHGTISSDKQMAIEGQTVAMSSRPDPGYIVKNYFAHKTGSPKDTVQVNDTVFQMPDFDVTVTAEFTTGYRVKIDTMTNGKVTATDTIVVDGNPVALIVKPAKGYQLNELYAVNMDDPSSSAPISDENVFQMPNFDVIIKGTFGEATSTYKVQPDTLTGHGRVIADVNEATRRETVMLKNVPEPGYQFKEYKIYQTGDTATKVTPMGNFFTMPDFDVTVSAVFTKNEGENQQQQQQDQNQDEQQEQQEQQQDQQQQDRQQQQNQQQNQQHQDQMSKEDAQRMLQALENQEKQTMEKVNEQKIRTQPRRKSDKDW